MFTLPAPVGSGRRHPRVQGWAASLAAGALFLFCLRHGDATVFCKALEVVGAGSQGAVPPTPNNNRNEEEASNTVASTMRQKLGNSEQQHSGLDVDYQHVATAQEGKEKEQGEEKEEEGDVGAEPEQIHLALAGSGVEKYGMTVAWATWPETSEPIVVWGTSPEDMNSAAEGSTTSKTVAIWK